MELLKDSEKKQKKVDNIGKTLLLLFPSRLNDEGFVFPFVTLYTSSQTRPQRIESSLASASGTLFVALTVVESKLWLPFRH